MPKLFVNIFIVINLTVLNSFFFFINYILQELLLLTAVATSKKHP